MLRIVIRCIRRPFVDLHYGAARHGHFCRALRVATEFGLYHHPIKIGCHRVVSEDPTHSAGRRSFGFLLIVWLSQVFQHIDDFSIPHYCDRSPTTNILDYSPSSNGYWLHAEYELSAFVRVQSALVCVFKENAPFKLPTKHCLRRVSCLRSPAS